MYYHFSQWSKAYPLAPAPPTVRPLQSSIQLDGSNTPTKNGEAVVGYQDRKAAHTTNALLVADNADQPLAIATPQAGQHHNTFELETLFAQLCA